MKYAKIIAISFGFASLAACNDSAREQQADNIEANADAVADNLEDAADETVNGMNEDALENQADAIRNTGENMATDVRTNDPDTNLANGM